MRHTLYASILFAVLGLATWLVPDSHLIVPHVDPAFVLLVVAAPVIVAGVIAYLRARHRSFVAGDWEMHTVAWRAAVMLLYAVALAVTCGIAWKAWIPLRYLRLPAVCALLFLVSPVLFQLRQAWRRAWKSVRVALVVVGVLLSPVALLLLWLLLPLLPVWALVLPDRPLRLAGLDLTGRDLTSARLAHANLSQANLGGAILRSATLVGADLSGADLTGTDLASADLSDANLSGAILTSTTILNGSTLSPEDLKKTRSWIFSSLEIRQLPLLGLPDDFIERLHRKALSGVRLEGADLRDADLSGFDLSLAHLRGANLGGANLDGACLTGADLVSVNLRNASLKRANLTGTALGGGALQDAELSDAILVGAELEDADLERANLERADIRRAALRCSRLVRTRNWNLAYRDEDLACNQTPPPAPDLRETIRRSVPPTVPDSVVSLLDGQAAARLSRKPRLSTLVLGHVDHGKTTLTAALDRVSARMYGGPFRSYEQISDAPNLRLEGVEVSCSRVEYESARRRYSSIDCQSHRDYIKSLIAGSFDLSRAILVVSAADGPMPQTREQLRLARVAGINELTVYMSKADLVDDKELLELVEQEIRELLRKYGYPAATPIVRGSGPNALGGEVSPARERSIARLMAAMDAHFSVPAVTMGRNAERGGALSSAHTTFEADVYMFSSDEGGRERPASNGYAPTLDFGVVSGGSRFDLQDVQFLKPGDSMTVTVSLNAPAAIQNGMRFVIREGLVERGRGVIARIVR